MSRPQPRHLPPTRIAGFGFAIDGGPVPLDRLVPAEDRAALAGTGQTFTYVSDADSTDLAVRAAAAALDQAGLSVDDISLVISAPSLLLAHGLDIPAVAIAARLGIRHAECLNVVQGCVGPLVGIRLATRHLAEVGGAALIAVGCKASSITRHMSHGAFIWGDAGGAVVLTAGPGPGLRPAAYAEISADTGYDAMRVPFGDGWQPAPEVDPHRIRVDFPDLRSRSAYVAAEKSRVRTCLQDLTECVGISAADLSAIMLPATGANRCRSLLGTEPHLIDKVCTDFSHPHLGGVDVLDVLARRVACRQRNDRWYAALSPAFTAQWAGMMFEMMD